MRVYVCVLDVASLSGDRLSDHVTVLALQQDVVKHSVHTLVFRSLKRTHDMFISEEGLPIPEDEERYMQTHKPICVHPVYVPVVYHMGQVMCVRVCLHMQ